MMTQQTSPTLLLLCILTLLVCSLIVCNWGRSLPARGSWLVWTGMMVLLAGVGLDSGLFLKNEFETKIWASGWIWPKLESGAITVGLFQDPLGLAMVILTVFIAGALLLNHSRLNQETYPERVLAAVGVSTSGVALAWTSLTPWVVFVGLILTIVGGFISIGSRWDSNKEAKIAARFIFEKSSGFLLAFFGACVLAASRLALLLNTPESWLIQTQHLKATWVGSILLVAGLFIQMQPFPLLGGLVSESEVYLPLRLLLGQVFPAWAAFPLLMRLEPQLQSLGLFSGFGWIALSSSILVVFTGLFQRNRHLSIGVWLSAGLSLTVALLAFSGPLPAMGMLIGVSLSSICLAGAASALKGQCAESVTNGKKAVWIKTATFLGVSAGTGVIGFVSATGGVRWIAQSLNLPAVAALYLFCFFLFGLLGWSIAWGITQKRKFSDASWLTIFSLYLLIFLSLGAVWTGTVTGDVIQGSPDRFMKSLLDLFFGQTNSDLYHSSNSISAPGLYWGVLLFAFFTAYWTTGRKEDRWVILSTYMPKTSQFIASGYGIDRALRRGMNLVEWCGKFAEQAVDKKIWAEWIPKGLVYGVRSISDMTNYLDSGLSQGLGEGLKKLVEIPAKILQLLQTGELRWYLFFSLGSGFALLAHYLKL